MKQNIIITFILFTLSLFSCSKKEAVETPDTLGEMSISAIDGATYKGDSLYACQGEKSLNYYLADNELTIRGANFGDEDGDVTTAETGLDLNVVEWNNTFIIIKIDAKNYLTEFKNPVLLTIKRADEKVLNRTINVVNNLSSFAQYSPTWFLLSHFEGQTAIIPDDFFTQMEAVTDDYEPELYDLVKVKGVFKIITKVPVVYESGTYKRYTFELSYMDCKGNTVTEYANINLSDGVKIAGENTPEYYFRN